MDLSLRVFFSFFALSLALQVDPVLAQAVEIADGEQEFVRQLRAKQFFDLAEQFCLRQSETCRTPDERATWQLMLAECREQHGWALEEPGRTQILSHAAQSITEFVRQDKPSAELDLLLRVRQIELLATMARIDATISGLGPRSTPHPLAARAIDEGLELATAMLKQIDQIRKDIINSGVSRTARDRTRYVNAELTLFQARRRPDDAKLMTNAVTAADALMKSSGDDDMRFQAKRLLAEASLDQQDFKRFDLLVTALSSAAENQSQQLAVAALRIRGLLRQDQPSEALQVCLDFEKQSLRSQELSTLRLSALLNMFELLHKLEAPELRQKTADEFNSLNVRLRTVTVGVWRECCERIALRFDHVQKFGPEAATVLESVAGLISAGDLAAARASLREMRESFATLKPQIAAILSFQAGDLAIRMSEWKAAEADLSEAVTLFHSTGNADQEAAADLLRTYAIGRRWDTEAAAATDTRNALEADYRRALEQHLAKFPAAATTAKAREWRAMLIRATEPIAAAEELLALAKRAGENSPATGSSVEESIATAGQQSLLIQAGEILIEVISDSGAAGPQSDPTQRSAALADWSKLTEQMLSRNIDEATPAVGNWSRSILEIQRLTLSLNRRWTAQDDWLQLALNARQQLTAIAAMKDSGGIGDQATGVSAEQQAQIQASEADGHAIVVLASFRQLLPLDGFQESRSVLLHQSGPKRLQIVMFLLRQTSDTGIPIPGDPQLGFLALDLLQGEETEAPSVDRQIEKLSILLTASKAADNFRQLDAVTDTLTAGPLTDAQMQTIATILQQRALKVSAKPTTSQSVSRFWQAVLKRSHSGDDNWLEASLQLATIAEQQQNIQEAARVLNVIDSLHPDWGTPERKARAAALKTRLELAQ